jgi:UDP:flavonoid glycosyltransferase YjiC (YdhE family)
LTTIPKINSPGPKRPKILIAPLDWGLGHATRCIPIIKELLTLQCEVIIAATGLQKALLEQEFPGLPLVELPGYDIKYGKNRAFTALKIIRLIPKILIRIKRENSWLRRFVRREQPDIVISDNRYGMYCKGVISVFMTHQLRIKTPSGGLIDRWLQRINYRAIRRFSICWIPDWEEDAGQKYTLAGELSHPDRLPVIPVRYIGPLSRFGKNSSADEGADGSMKVAAGESCDVVILLSGPEPQRSRFEKMILAQLAFFEGTAILVRGLPDGKWEKLKLANESLANESLGPGPGKRDQWRVYDHLPANRLHPILCGAGLVISRSGYSSVMDLFKLGKKCIFIPTPGQTEQEYLGEYLSARRLAVCIPQARFNLPMALAEAGQFPFAYPVFEEDGLLRKEIGNLLWELNPQENAK